MDYIIVQAGGRGTRLGYLTENKPKGLVPVGNLPMLFHLFQKYPDKKYVIIADYKKDVLREYLSCFARVAYQVVDASGTGTCAGVAQAVSLLPENKPFMLVWSDLILPQELPLPAEYGSGENAGSHYVGISHTFSCRWAYKNGKFLEEPSLEHGVAGLFLFAEKNVLEHVPPSGEFVRWLKDSPLRFQEISLAGTKEFGTLEAYGTLEREKCRPFNRISFHGDRVVKEGIDEQGKKLAVRECAWYEKAREMGICALPKIYGTNPLQMERIDGKNIYEYELNQEEKREILERLTDSLEMLHKKEEIPADTFSTKEAYFYKTMDRLRMIRDLVPFADKKTIMVNGRECRNIFFYKRDLERRLERMSCGNFCFIHGDCTFSNVMLRRDGSPVLIDPRGYFGCMMLYGDPRYDWTKLYYSLAGNYDRFNLKDFRLSVKKDGIALEIASNGWEDMEEDFFRLTNTDQEEIRLLHAVVWLSLTTYAWQDYDSICGAFYNGLYHLEEVMGRGNGDSYEKVF